MMEARLHERTWWTTLTYSKEMRPHEYIHPETGQLFCHEQGCLNPKQFEDFIKRVRKQIHPLKLRYFAVGEYGDLNNAPHYHICIFGHGEEINRILQKCWSDPISNISLGFVDTKSCRPLDTATARYTCGYTLKKLTKKSDPLLEGRYPEYTSHSIGIGMGFALRYANALKNESGKQHILTHHDIPRFVRYDGKNWPLDRYLRAKILEHLGITDVLMENGRKKFKTEMQALSNRAELNPKFSSQKGQITPYALEEQYKQETAQRVLNTETRAKLKPEGKKL